MRRDLVCHTDETRIRREAGIRNNDVADYFHESDNQKRAEGGGETN